MFYFLMFVYIGAGLCAYIPVHRFFNARCASAMVCSCKAAATVKDACRHGRFGWHYTLDYYDHGDKHYLVSFFTDFFSRRWMLNQIIEIYYNPSNPMQISVPDDAGLLSDARWTARMAGILYIAFGLFAVVCWKIFLS